MKGLWLNDLLDLELMQRQYPAGKRFAVIFGPTSV
jgi:hypothetical protein